MHRLFRLLKPRLRALVLSKWMKLTNEKPAAGNQYASCFAENELQVLDVLQDQITHNEIKKLIVKGPAFRDVGNLEGDMGRAHALLCLLDHSCREIERAHSLTNVRQQTSILPRAATQFECCFATQVL